jgi:hypothetical protein
MAVVESAFFQPQTQNFRHDSYSNYEECEG